VVEEKRRRFLRKEKLYMLLNNVRWRTSETKKIYQATVDSERLMEYLEEKLMQTDLIKMISEDPNPKRGYGVLYFYYSVKPRKRLLSAAPRRNNSYIHVVLFNHLLSQETLQQNGFTIGNSDIDPDILVKSKEEIDTLVDLLKRNFRIS
jgi:hypothetical protein